MATKDATDLNNADTWVELVFWIPGVMCRDEGDYPDNFVDEFVFGLPTSKDDPIYTALPQLAALPDHHEAEHVTFALLSAEGFLVQAATAVRKYSAGGSYETGRSYYTHWVYARKAEEIAPALLAWAETSHAKDRAKAGL